MKGKWQAHERKLKGTSDYPWTAIETKMKSTIFEISLNISECCKPSSLLGTNTYEHWSKITPKSVPARKHQTLKDCCLNLFDQTVLCQVPALCDVQWQGSHSQWPCFLTNNARPWEQIQENLRLAGLLQGFIDKLPVLSGTLFRDWPMCFLLLPFARLHLLHGIDILALLVPILLLRTGRSSDSFQVLAQACCTMKIQWSIYEV